MKIESNITNGFEINKVDIDYSDPTGEEKCFYQILGDKNITRKMQENIDEYNINGFKPSDNKNITLYEYI